MSAESSSVSPQETLVGSGLETGSLTPARSLKQSEAPAAKSNLARYSEWAWMAAIVALFALHAVHLRADFPNYSPWMDYAKYTDEGWYGNAAIEAFVRGSWYVPGDFNSAVALPVFPFLEWLLFHFTGVSIVAARGFVVALFGANLLLSYALVRTAQARLAPTPPRHAHNPPGLAHHSHGLAHTSGLAHNSREQTSLGSGRWVALLAATLIAASSFLYCFGRLAILEPLVIFFLLLSWLLALGIRPASLAAPKPGHRTLSLLIIGILLCLMVLTKTTALVLLPSVFYLVWHSHRGQPRRSLKACGIVMLAAVVPGLLYYYFLVRPRYLVDFKYLFSANVYPQPTTAYGWMMAYWYGIHGGLWMDHAFFILTAALLFASAVWMRVLWRNPLYVAGVVALVLQILFIGYHNNMQPRYYIVAAYPMLILVALGVQVLVEVLRQRRLLAGLALAIIGMVAAHNAWRTIGYARHPQYTFVNAAENLTRYIDQHPNGNRLLLSISGNEIGLITGLPAICDDFGTLDLPHRIHQYQPGWYAAWNDLDDGTLEDLHTQFQLEQVAKYPAFDDPDRNVLVLYKLHPLPPSQQGIDEDGDFVTQRVTDQIESHPGDDNSGDNSD